MPEFQTTKDLFHSSLESVCGMKDWNKASRAQKKNFIMVMLDRFEASSYRRKFKVWLIFAER